MMSYWLLIPLLSSLLASACEMPPYPSPGYPAYPSHGDIRLCPNGLVMIYMGPDGTNIENLWGTFSGDKGSNDKSANMKHIANTLCQQLGLNNGKIYRVDASKEAGDYPVFMTNVTCDSTYQHIMRCRYDDANSMNHKDDWKLTCFERLSGTTYFGRVALLPPISVNTLNISKSTGVLIVLNKEEEWSFVKTNSLGTHIADTACRTMGYTHAMKNSVMTVGEYRGYGGNYTFDLSTMFSLPQIHCNSTYRCLSCCDGFSQSTKFKLSTPSEDQALVLRCSFYIEPTPQDPHNPLVSGGYEEICKIGSDYLCTATDDNTSSSFDTTIPILSVLVCIFFTTTMVLISGITYKVYKGRWGYIRIGGENGGVQVQVNGGGAGGGQGDN